MVNKQPALVPDMSMCGTNSYQEPTGACFPALHPTQPHLEVQHGPLPCNHNQARISKRRHARVTFNVLSTIYATAQLSPPGPHLDGRQCEQRHGCSHQESLPPGRKPPNDVGKDAAEEEDLHRQQAAGTQSSRALYLDALRAACIGIATGARSFARTCYALARA